MIHFDEKEEYFLFCNRADRGWKLANGNLHTRAAAIKAAETLRSEGLEVRLTRVVTSLVTDFD